MDSIKSFSTFWLSKIILKIVDNNIKTLFREIEKKSIKFIEVSSHRAFNECCLNNNLLPNYTNIYIYMYIYIYIHIYIYK